MREKNKLFFFYLKKKGVSGEVGIGEIDYWERLWREDVVDGEVCCINEVGIGCGIGWQEHAVERIEGFEERKLT